MSLAWLPIPPSARSSLVVHPSTPKPSTSIDRAAMLELLHPHNETRDSTDLEHGHQPTAGQAPLVPGPAWLPNDPGSIDIGKTWTVSLTYSIDSKPDVDRNLRAVSIRYLDDDDEVDSHCYRSICPVYRKVTIHDPFQIARWTWAIWSPSRLGTVEKTMIQGKPQTRHQSTIASPGHSSNYNLDRNLFLYCYM